MRTIRSLTALAAVFVIFSPAAVAATPPDVVNFQGVLRDSADDPESGSFDMVFRFFDAAAGGQEILIDEHLAAGTGDVTVSAGLFNVGLGGGNVVDGAAALPNDPYTSLAQAFRDFGEVWVQIEIDPPPAGGGFEVLSPRVRVVAAAYALNADHLDGKAATEFIDTSAAMQVKSGNLTVNQLRTQSVGDYSKLCVWSTSTYCLGMISGQSFGDLNDWSMTFTMNNDPDRGFLWRDDADAANDGAMSLTTTGNLTVKTDVETPIVFDRDDPSYYADPAGISVLNTLYLNGTSAYVNRDGPDATTSLYFFNGGSPSAEYFRWDDANDTFMVSDDLALATDQMLAFRASTGGLLTALHANDAANYTWHYDYQNSRYLVYSDADGIGIGTAVTQPGYLVTTPSIYNTGGATYGVFGRGASGGGRFEDTSGGTQDGEAYLGTNQTGGFFYGSFQGTYASDNDTASYARSAYNTYKIFGSGTVSFVQNHPVEDDRVIVYAAPEGDEVATYTRGTARLESGVARVALGETFQWVTNPDIGLTAYVTPRGESGGLFVESLSTTELVVRESGGGTGNVPFDYIVYGLRIGFEESSIVQEKVQEAYIPAMTEHRDLYQRLPELRSFNASERFRRMTAAGSRADSGERDLTAATALRDAIGEFDPRLHELPRSPEVPARGSPTAVGADSERTPPAGEAPADGPAPGAPTGVIASSGVAPSAAAPSAVAPMALDRQGNAYARSFRPSSTDLAEYHPVAEPVEVGDVLVADRESPGTLRLGRSAADPAVVGVVAGEPGVLLGGGMTRIETADPALAADLAEARAIGDAGAQAELWARLEARFQQTHAPIALTGTVAVKVDAGYGAIRVGDLLAVSPTPGRAMRVDDPAPGTVLGKALEALETGTGVIRVLVMLR